MSAPAPPRCFGDLSAGVLCSQILKAFTPKRHQGRRKLQIKVLPFHRVSKQLVLNRSCEITELLHGTTCRDLPGKRCSCPTSETIKKSPIPQCCFGRGQRKKRNLFNSGFWTLSSLFSAKQHLLILLLCIEGSFFPYLLLGSCIYIWFSVFLVIRMFLFLRISEALFGAWVCPLPANFSLPFLCSRQC